jgi:hypothetical protein
MSSPEEGGTKIQKRNSAPPMMGGGPSQGMPQQGMSQEQMMMMQQQQLQQQQQQQQQFQQQQMQQQIQQPPTFQLNSSSGPKKGILRKNLSNVSLDSATIKNTILVIIIFLALNSKIIWKQILHFPFMGGVEPSIIALIVNSILAGIVFYLISTFLIC